MVEDEYQFKVIKRKKIYPNIGDIFKMCTPQGIELYGVVINNHINNVNGEDWLIILIFKNNIDVLSCLERGVSKDDLLIPPQILGNGYWTRGYFFNVDNYKGDIKIPSYGFYDLSSRTFCNEFDDELDNEPILKTISGVCTISGIAYMVNQELIIEGII